MEISLNQKQQEAVAHFKGPIMVLAGPGSGKTTVIACRVKKLIEDYGVAPRDILVITFSKAAAEEMCQRFEALSPNVSGITFATFHSFFYRIIRRDPDLNIKGVLEERAAHEMILTAMSEGARLHNDEELSRQIQSEISLVKNELVDIANYYSPNMSCDMFRAVYEAYERIKEREGLIDFDDMLVKCYTLLKNNEPALMFWQSRHNFVLIDEFQDINRAQYECVKLLTAKHRNLFIVGDDDQSIYSFRGASPQYLLRFPKDFADAKSIVLDINYRSTQRIINLCETIISVNKYRYSKKINGTGRTGGDLKVLNPPDITGEAMRIATMIKNKPQHLKYEDFAVLYRTNLQSRAFVDVFIDMNIPFKLKDQVPGIYEHWIARDICAYLRLALNNAESGSFNYCKDNFLAGYNPDIDLAKIMNHPKRFISNKTIRAARYSGMGLVKYLLSPNVLQIWQRKKIMELMDALPRLSELKPYEAIKRLRHVMKYDTSIEDYAEYRKLDASGLYEIIEEIMESAKGFESIQDFLTHVKAAEDEYRQMVVNARDPDNPGVTLSSIHSAKGLEYDTIFIAGAVDGVLPHKLSKLETEIEEERRLLYVAMTRAKTNLYVSVMRTRYDKKTKISSFFEGIVPKHE